MGNFKYFTKFPVYRINKIYLILTAGQLSWLERRANNANVVGSTPTLAKSLYMFMNIRFMDYVQEYNGKFQIFHKIPRLQVNKIYLILRAGQLSRLERRANNANVVGSTPTLAKFLLYVHEYSIYGLCSGI